MIVICRLTMLRNTTSSRAGDLTRSSYVISVILISNPSTINSQECFQRRSQGFQRVTMPRLCPPILTRTGKHTPLRHYLRVSTFHRSIVIDLHAENPSQDRQRQGAKSKIFWRLLVYLRYTFSHHRVVSSLPPNTKSRSPSTFLAAPSRYNHSLLATSLYDFAK